MTNRRNELLLSIERSAVTIKSLGDQVGQIDTICEVVIESLRAGNKVLTAGFGGSAADALHMSEELVGRFKSNRRSLPAVSLVADPTLLTCIVNDFGADRLFSRQIEGLGNAGDVLVLFSTSGNAPALKFAIEAARAQGVKVVAMLGKGGGAIAGLADHELIVTGDETARIQEAHTLAMHLVLEAVEQAFANAG